MKDLQKLVGLTVALWAAVGLAGNVREFGAVGDGVTDDTAAIQRAIDAGGVVKIPKGVYLMGSVYLKSNGGLDLDDGAVLKAHPDPSKWSVRAICIERESFVREGFTSAHLICAVDVTNVVIRGGVVDGNWEAFHTDAWHLACGGRRQRNAKAWRPAQMVWFCESADVRVENVRLRNAPFWNLFFHGCERVRAVGLDIESSEWAGEDDGIDIDCCRDVEVTDCRIVVGDDGIAVRAYSRGLTRRRPCEDIRVRNCRVKSHYAHALRVGVGDGEIRNVSFKDVDVDGTRGAVWVCSKYRKGPGVEIRGVRFDGVKGDAVCWLFVRHDYKFVDAREPFRGGLEDLAFVNCRGKTAIPPVVRGNGVATLKWIDVSGLALDVVREASLAEGEYQFFMARRVEEPLKVLHVDCNTIRLKTDAIREILRFAADVGYTDVLWEVEDKIRWETCPDCVHPDALSKAEFRELLAYARELGLRPIPLLQTFAHAEYVLGCDRYRLWRELSEHKDCYCVSRKEVRTFLSKWIEEYLDLFGSDVRDFHLGGDEAHHFGKCAVCSRQDRMTLYAEHLKEVAAPLRLRGVRPGIWCDMILSAGDKTETAKIPRDFTVWHWDYGYRGKNDEKFAVWAGKTKVLTELGFDVIFAASSSCYGDSPFLPDYGLHFDNVIASAELVRREKLMGLCVTSWSIRQGLKTLQKPIWECALTGDVDAAVRKAFGASLTRQTLADLSCWSQALTRYDGRDWHNWMKDAVPAPPGELQRILKRTEASKPDFREDHLDKADALEKRISSALETIAAARDRSDAVRLLEEGARQELAFLRCVKSVLRGETPTNGLQSQTTASFATEQLPTSATNSSAIVWSVLFP